MLRFMTIEKHLLCNYKIVTLCNYKKYMGTKKKLINRFKSQPKDFTWDELVRLFSVLGYKIDNKGEKVGHESYS